MNKEALPYRPCVGIALFNEEGKVFVGSRIDTPGAWQMPQGGIDPGEDLTKAAFRELLEEIGTNNIEILKIHETPLRYDLPDHLLGKLFDGKFRGQEQIWVAAKFKGNDEEIDINAHHLPEFDDWKWISLDNILDMIVPFKKDIYQQVIKAFNQYSKF
jgi:putative (di)nucleoside polyphosphate hydrolase